MASFMAVRRLARDQSGKQKQSV